MGFKRVGDDCILGHILVLQYTTRLYAVVLKMRMVGILPVFFFRGDGSVRVVV